MCNKRGVEYREKMNILKNIKAVSSLEEAKEIELVTQFLCG